MPDTTSMRLRPNAKPMTTYPRSCFDCANRLLTTFRPDLSDAQRRLVLTNLAKLKRPGASALTVADRLSEAAPIYALDERNAPVLTLDVAFFARRRPSAGIEHLRERGWVLVSDTDPEVLPGFYILHLRAQRRPQSTVLADLTDRFGWRRSSTLFDGAISVVPEGSPSHQLAFS